MTIDVGANLQVVKNRLQDACLRSGRSPKDVAIIAVSKTVESSLISAAYEHGITDFGENRPQELIRKSNALARGIRWHLIGHLQKNKIKSVLHSASRIQSVDSLALLSELERIARAENVTLPAYLEVNVSRESQKHGFLEEELPAALEFVRTLSNVKIDGLMTVAQFTTDTEILRSQFSTLRTLRDTHGVPSWDLSMGMSHDFEIAIEEGATVVRIGSAIFGDRS